MTKEEARIKREEYKCKIETCNDSIKYMEGKIAELEAIIKKKDNWRDKLVQPETSDYYKIDRDSRVGLKVSYTYSNRNNRKPEHAFRTQTQAELVKDKMLLMQEIHAFAHVKNEGWIPDWKDRNQKWGLSYDAWGGLQTYINTGCNDFVFGVSVKSEEIAQEMLEEFGERIESLYNKQY